MEISSDFVYKVEHKHDYHYSESSKLRFQIANWPDYVQGVEETLNLQPDELVGHFHGKNVEVVQESPNAESSSTVLQQR